MLELMHIIGGPMVVDGIPAQLYEVGKGFQNKWIGKGELPNQDEYVNGYVDALWDSYSSRMIKTGKTNPQVLLDELISQGVDKSCITITDEWFKISLTNLQVLVSRNICCQEENECIVKFGNAGHKLSGDFEDIATVLMEFNGLYPQILTAGRISYENILNLP